MARTDFKIKNGLNIQPVAGAAPDVEGSITMDATAHKASLHNGTSASPLVTEAHTSTLTNKTIDADSNTITNIENADIKAGAAIDATKIADGSVSSTEFQYINSLTSNAQTQLNTKAPTASPTFTGTITTPLTASRAVVTGASNELAAATTTATEIGYVSGVTSAIQTQLDAKTSYTANQYGVVLSGSGNTMTVLAPDASTTKVLTSGGTSANPTWSAAATGTVTSVAASGPTGIATWSSAITSSGTLTQTLSTQSANTMLAGPVSGGAATPAFRAIVAADLPTTWTTYTPTITAGSGTFTTVSGAGRHLQVGNIMHFQITVTITTNGTAASSIIATLPTTAATVSDASWFATGMEQNATAKQVFGFVLSAGTNITMRYYDATYPGGTGYKVAIAGWYQTA